MSFQSIKTVVFLTNSDMSVEPPSNRINWANEFNCRGFRVLIVQQTKAGAPNIRGSEAVEIIHGKSNFLEMIRSRKIEVSETLFWHCCVDYADIVGIQNSFNIFHVTENWFDPNSGVGFDFSLDVTNLQRLRTLVENVNAILPVSGAIYDDAINFGVEKSKLLLSSNSVDMRFYGTGISSSRRSRSIIYQGAVNKRLDLELIITLASELPNYRFDLFGKVSISNRDLRKIGPNVFLHGEVDREVLKKAMSEAFAGLIPFRAEEWLEKSHPLKFFEYLACGLPVISTRITDLRKYSDVIFELSSPLDCVQVESWLSQAEIEELREQCYLYASNNSVQSRFDELIKFLDKQVDVPLTRLDSERNLHITRVAIIYDPLAVITSNVHAHLRALLNISDFDVYAVPYIDALKQSLQEFDILIWHYSFRICFSNSQIDRLVKVFASHHGIRALFIQDEYNNTNLAKMNIVKAKFSLVFTCVPVRSLQVFYPEVEFVGVKFINVLTGFIPDRLLDRLASPNESRSIHIGYRGRELGFEYGDLGRDKSQIGIDLLCALRGRSDINLDIEISESSRFVGDQWLKFLGSCVATLVTESGSNIIDSHGELAKVAHSNKFLSYQSFRSEFIGSREINGLMNQLSPRVFEAAAMRTLIISYEDSFSDYLRDGIDFFGLRRDLSNLNELVDLLQNAIKVRTYTDSAYDHIVKSGRFSQSSFQELVRSSLLEQSFYAGKVSRPSLDPSKSASWKFIRKTTASENFGLLPWQRPFPGRKIIRKIWRVIPPERRARFASTIFFYYNKVL